jgi:hypothetical protein
MRPLTSSARSAIAHLMSAQYIKRRWHTRVYVITERDREALIEMTAGMTSTSHRFALVDQGNGGCEQSIVVATSTRRQLR